MSNKYDNNTTDEIMSLNDDSKKYYNKQYQRNDRNSKRKS